MKLSLFKVFGISTHFEIEFNYKQLNLSKIYSNRRVNRRFSKEYRNSMMESKKRGSQSKLRNYIVYEPVERIVSTYGKQ